MKLEDAIQHCEEVANDRAGCCEDCVEEHRQLAEWLKDYKRLLEQPPLEKALEEINEEISHIAVSEQIDRYTAMIRTGEQVKTLVLKIIDSHISGKE